jgi:MoxR-like ATPase
MNISRGLAALSGRNFVIPDDVKKIAVDVLSHRIMLKPEARLMKRTPEEIIHEILNTVEVPLIND